MKPSFKIESFTITEENPESGVKHSIEIAGIEIQSELSLQEMIQIGKDGAAMGDRLMKFIRGELPDVIRNCGKAICEVRDTMETQQLAHKEQKFLLKQRLKAKKKVEESDPKA
jgi:hypothetical protein